MPDNMSGWERMRAITPEAVENQAVDLLREMYLEQRAAHQALVDRAWAGDSEAIFELAISMGSNFGPTVGSIKLKPGITFNRFKKVMAGENPLDMTAQQYGKYVTSLGPDSRLKGAELLGSQGIDQHKTTDLTQLIRRRLESDGVSASEMPKIHISGEGPLMEGAYVPPSVNEIWLDRIPEQYLIGPDGRKLTLPQHPIDYEAGVGLHEALHARQNIFNEQDFYSPEMFPPSRMSNNRLSWAGLFEPHRIEAYLKYAKDNPGMIQLPSYVERALSSGASPQYLSEIFRWDENFLKDMAKNYRIIKGNAKKGNAGFKGTDPYLSSVIEQADHFGPPVKTEAEVPVMYLAEQQAKAGGDIGPWEQVWPHQAKQWHDQYRASILPVKYNPPGLPAVVKPATATATATATKKAAFNPWLATAIGLGGGAAGYLLGDYFDDPKKPEAEMKPQNRDNQVLNPSPTASPENPDETSFWRAVDFLRDYLKQ